MFYIVLQIIIELNKKHNTNSMLSVNIPERDKDAFVSLFQIEDTVYDSFLNKVKNNVTQKSILEPTGILEILVEDGFYSDRLSEKKVLVKLLVAIALSKEQESKQLPEKFYQVYSEINSHSLSKEDFISQFKKLIQISNLFKHSAAILAAKQSYDRVLVEQSISIDIKPIFSENNQLEGNVIFHKFTLEYDDREEEEESKIFSIVLDKKELLELKDIIEQNLERQAVLEEKYK